MTCSSCGGDNRPGRKFCATCGTALAVACAACGAANEPSDRFCGECGTALASDGPAATADPRAGARAVTNRGRVAERRLVTVLFADLVGFTPYSEGRDAEDVRAMLSRYFEVATEIVTRYGGTVEKFIGDAVMAVWGVPAAHEDDAERAVRAALDLVQDVPDLDAGLQARAGILSGDVAVTLGATNEGMVAGDIVNTAARLQSAAAPGTVLVGDATYHAASTSISFERVPDQPLKGKATPVPAWQATRVFARRGGHGRSELPEPPFVGRDDELRVLKDVLHATGRDRRPRLVSITGSAGIGKSRLAWELEKYADGVVEDVAWHRGRCPAYGDGITFWALGEMVRRRAGLAESDDEPTTRTRIAETVAAWIPGQEDRAWVEPALLTLLGVQSGAATSREVLFAAWRIFFERIAARSTTVLLFEDLQWADSGLLDFIDHLLEWSKQAPIVVITLSRPELFERRPGWGTTTRNPVAMGLAPLPEAPMRELLAGFAPGLPEHASDRIVVRAEGVPLYAVELVRSLVAGGRLQAIDGVYQASGAIDDVAIPETLRSLIASRLDALEPADRALVQDASVLGQVFAARSLAEITGRTEAALERRLRLLIRKQLVELEADPRSPERGQYRFVQSLIREVAYGTLARPDRRARHLAAATFYETQADEELAGAVASHYLAAYEASTKGAEANDLAQRAVEALRAAARRAAHLGAHHQAVAYLRQALDAAHDPTVRAGLQLDAGGSALAVGWVVEAEGFAREAIRTSSGVGDAVEVGRGEALLGRTLVDAGKVTEAVDTLERALDALADVDDRVRAVLLAELTRALMRAVHPARAVARADEALVLAERLDAQDVVAATYTSKGPAIANLGRPGEAAILLEAAVRIAADHELVATQLRAMNNLGVVLQRADLRRANRILRDGLELAERVGSRAIADTLATSALINDFDLGDDWTSSLGQLEAALERPSDPVVRHRRLFATCLYTAYRGDPQIDTFLAEMERTTDVFSDPNSFAGLEAARGWRAMAAGDLGTAYERLTAAMDRVETFGEYAATHALRAAAWARDAERLRAARDRYATGPSTGPLVRLQLATATAGIDGLEGRTADAVRGYGEVLTRFAELEVHAARAFAGLEFVITVGADEPEARAAAEEARGVFERLGALPVLARLEAALADTSAAAGT